MVFAMTVIAKKEEPMSAPYTHLKLTEVENVAAKAGIDEMEARFPNAELEIEQTGLSHHRLRPDARQPFGHKHERAEEIFVVISGSGRVKLDDEILELERLDAVRIAPQVMRNFEAGPEGLEMLAFGARHEGDAETVPGWWSD
jgi:mannose-6-phosphate isomerase-like protein (cupin superfamily)